MKIAIIQHEEIVGPGTIPAILRFVGAQVVLIKPYKGIPLPDPSEYDGYIILGGTMSVQDTFEYSFIAEEMHWLKFLMDADKPLLGICLGGQLMSLALGGKVTRCSEPEIGFHEVTRSQQAASDYTLTKMFPAERFESFFWHSWKFSVPEGCIPLGSTKAGAVQGFSKPGGAPAVAVQFHPESTTETVRALIKHQAWELKFPPVWAADPAELARKTKPLVEQMNAILRVFVGKG